MPRESKALLWWLIIISGFAVGVAIMGPLFVSLVALDSSPEGLGLFLALFQ